MAMISLKVCIINLAVINIYIAISFADKKDISQSKDQPKALAFEEGSNESEHTNAGGRESLADSDTMTRNKIHHADFPGDDTGLQPSLYSYWQDVQTYELPPDMSKTRSDSDRNLEYNTWKYMDQNRQRRSVIMPDEETFPAFEPSDSSPYKRMLGSALNVRYGTWRYQNPGAQDGDTLYSILSKRPSLRRKGGPVMNRWQAIWGSPGKRARAYRPVMHRWQSIWGSPGKRGLSYRPVMNRWQSIWGSPGKRSDIEEGWYYPDENTFSEDDLIQEAKRPMAIGPAIDWNKFIRKGNYESAIDDSYDN